MQPDAIHTHPKKTLIMASTLNFIAENWFILLVFFGVFGGHKLLEKYWNYRKRRHLLEKYHAERMAALQQGLAVPPLPENFFKSYGEEEEEEAGEKLPVKSQPKASTPDHTSLSVGLMLGIVGL